MKNTGGTKFDGDKVRMDLLSPDFLFAVAEVSTYGAKKYAPWNWAKGFDWSRTYGALQRHLNAWWMGENTDPETGLSHLAHAACNLMYLVTFERRKMGKDDRFPFPRTTNVCLPVQAAREEESLSSKREPPRKLRTVQQFVDDFMHHRGPYAIECDERMIGTVLVRWTSIMDPCWYQVSMSDAMVLMTERAHADRPAPTARSAQVVRVAAGECDECHQEQGSCRCPNETAMVLGRRFVSTGESSRRPDAPNELASMHGLDLLDSKHAAPTPHFHHVRREVEE